MDDEALAFWRGQVRAWLATVLPPRGAERRVWGEGDEDLAVFRTLSHADESALLDRVRAYRRARFDAGYGALTLPAESGGAGLPAVCALTFTEEERAFQVPPSSEIISV